MFKVLQAGLQQYMNWELPDAQAGFRKGRETRDQIANIHWIVEKAREFQKNIYFCFTDYTKAFAWITTNCEIFLKRWEYQTTFPASWETCLQDKKQELESDMEQRADSKLGTDQAWAAENQAEFSAYATVCDFSVYIAIPYEAI